jgi:hypothetical protein
MANLKEIRNRITSVNSTMQITSAMKMVSAAKLKRAQDAITQMRPYAEKLQDILGNLSSSLDANENPILYVGLAEDTIFFNAPNGEDLHHNVFREELYGTSGTGISLNDVVGYQASFDFTVERHVDWDISRMFAFAILHDSSSDEVLQSGASNFTPDYSASITEKMLNNYKYFNNYNILTIEFEQEDLYDNVLVIDLQGKVLISEQITQQTIQLDLQSFNSALYIVQLINESVPTGTSFKIFK